MSYKNKSLWLATAALVLVVHALAAPLAYGQAATFSRLLGTVRDQTGAVVPGVEVTATATATNIPHMAVTNDRGDYVVDKLIPGFYDISAELPGFKVARSLGVRLEVQTVSRVDLTMEPGDISEQVTVTGQSTIIDTDNAEVAAVIEEKKILDLPLAGRDMVKLAYLTTGGTQERQEIGYSTLYAYGGGYPTFNGLYSHSNQIQLDGSNNMGYITQRPTVQPTPETVQEFKVITNNYSAEYGRVGGAVITMLSKSGSNEFHGHAWYYFRDEGLRCGQLLPEPLRIAEASGGLPHRRRLHRRSRPQGQDLLPRPLREVHRQPANVSGFATAPSTAIHAGRLFGIGRQGGNQSALQSVRLHRKPRRRNGHAGSFCQQPDPGQHAGGRLQEDDGVDAPSGSQPGGRAHQQLRLSPGDQHQDRQVLVPRRPPVRQRRQHLRSLQLAAVAPVYPYRQLGGPRRHPGRHLPPVPGPVPRLPDRHQLGEPHRFQPGDRVHAVHLEVHLAHLAAHRGHQLASGSGIRRRRRTGKCICPTATAAAPTCPA